MIDELIFSFKASKVCKYKNSLKKDYWFTKEFFQWMVCYGIKSISYM